MNSKEQFPQPPNPEMYFFQNTKGGFQASDGCQNTIKVSYTHKFIHGLIYSARPLKLIDLSEEQTEF